MASSDGSTSSSPPPDRHALDGVRVLDLSRVLAGPLCCMMLGDHGADVIKVEPPQGDETRTWGPPFVDGQSAYYLNINRNKRGIVLNLATPDGQDVVRRLVMTSDVLVENFLGSDTMERWGLGYDALRQLNPRLIYASISGFGRDGPYAKVAGYDAAVQALAGFMSINGEAGGQPLKAGTAVVDLATGLYASQAILLALYERFRSGVGQRVEVSLLEAGVSLLHPHSSAFLNAGVVGKPHGNSYPMISPYDLVHTADRPIYLPSGNDGQVQRLFGVIGRPDLVDDSRFRTNQDRITHRAALLAVLNEELAKRPAAEWCRLLWAASVPAGPVNTMPEVFSDPQVQHRQIVVETPHPGLSAGVVKTIKPPAMLHDTPGSVRRPPPRKGEHTREVLLELGYTDAELKRVLDAGATQAFG
jgi:crotonobetainyl-CoA:carnitine CoA-transferase CaiB-like acyl-CoA transferase